MAFMKKSAELDDEIQGNPRGFYAKNEMFKHQLGRILYFFRQLVGGQYFCNAQIFLNSRNKDTRLS